MLETDPSPAAPAQAPAPPTEWTREAVTALFDASFADLLFRAQRVHREHDVGWTHRLAPREGRSLATQQRVNPVRRSTRGVHPANGRHERSREVLRSPRAEDDRRLLNQNFVRDLWRRSTMKSPAQLSNASVG